MQIDLEAAQVALAKDPKAQPVLGEWEKFRFQSTANLYTKLHAALHAIKPTIDLRYNLHMSARNPQAWGIDVGLMSKSVDSMRIMDYSEQQGDVAALEAKRTYLARIRKEAGDAFPLVSAVAVRPKANPDLIRRGIQICVDGKMDGVTLGFYDGADFPNLRAVRDGLSAAGMTPSTRPAL